MTGGHQVLIGIDSGQTAGKVAVYDTLGTQLSCASAPAQTSNPHPHWVERDMIELWTQIGGAIRAAFTDASATVGELEVLGVGICGHGDGAYPVDAGLAPIRQAILATDSRASAQASLLGAGAAGSALLDLTGQVPYAGSPAALYRWLRQNEPDLFFRSRWLLFCKDWVRLQLTGDVATDRTEASASFTDVHDARWSDQALVLYDLAELVHRLPPIRGCAQIAGTVTPAASAVTSLPVGTPVVTGAHDVDAAALGIGAIDNGSASIILGTFSINQIVADRPVNDRRWQARPFIEPGQWLHMSTSPAGAANLDWALRSLGPWRSSGDPDPGAAVAQVFAAAEIRSSHQILGAPLFVPFLYGAPHGHAPGASWYGLRGWHGQDDLLMAVLEGVAFNHRTHLDALREVFAVHGAVRVCGGGARSTAWTQLLSDVLGLPVEITDGDEAGARGAAMLAGIGTGVYPNMADAVTACVRVLRRQEPNTVQARFFEQRYTEYQRLVAALDQVRRADS